MKNEKEGGKECGASLPAAPPGLAPARGCAPHWTVGVGCSGVYRAPAAFLASACQFGFAIREPCHRGVRPAPMVQDWQQGLHEACSGGGRTWPSPGGSSAQGAVLAAARSPGTESRNQSNSICISSLHCIGYLISAPMAKLAD